MYDRALSEGRGTISGQTGKAFGGSEILENYNIGLLENYNIDILEYRNIGISEYWNIMIF